MTFKRLLTTIFAVLVLTMAPAGLLVGQASAVDIFKDSCSGQDSNSSVCSDVTTQQKNGGNPVIKTLRIVIQLLALVIGVGAIIIIIISGLRMVMSSGDAQSATTARHALTYALIGLVVAAFAQAFEAFVLNRL